MKWIKKSTDFVSETRAEMRKVTFPSKDELIGTTTVVLVTSVIFAFYLWVADLVIMRIYEGLFRVLGS